MRDAGQSGTYSRCRQTVGRTSNGALRRTSNGRRWKHRCLTGALALQGPGARRPPQRFTFCRLPRQERGITFEDIVFHVAHGGLLNTIEHPNQRRYAGQRIFIVKVEEYVCLVPFVEDDEVILLKTIMPSRKMTKLYLRGDAE